MVAFDLFGSEWDRKTVTSEGLPVHQGIDGVLTRKTVTHVDHRGRLFEVLNGDEEFWAEPIVHSYVFTIRRNTLKGWGAHAEKSDRYCLIDGEAMTLLYDARPESPTYGVRQEVPMSPEGFRMVLIPPGVWHLSLNTAPRETILINFPTRPYIYDSPDRVTLPWQSPEIPFDVAAYFPRQH